MSITVASYPSAEDIAELKPLLEKAEDAAFIPMLERSLSLASSKAKEPRPIGLDPALYEALPFNGMNGWPATIHEYVDFLVRFSCWIPQQSSDPVWLDPDSKVGEHQEVYDRLCYFYWLIDQPLEELKGKTLQSIPWFAEFLVGYAKVWGDFLDTTESFNDDILESFMSNSPEYRIEDSMIGDPLRPNAASGWLTFNQFFARELNPGLRPIKNIADNTSLTSPADCTYKQHYNIGPTGAIPAVTLKGTHCYANVGMLLGDQGSEYASAFNNGNFIHFFLGPYSYHRFHTPVAGIVKEVYALTGDVYLDVSLSKGQFEAADSAENGYEFLQARGVIIIDTADSEFGDIGLVAVIPVGMCQVSGVNMTFEEGMACNKGDEFGYFTFGGSDIIVLTQAEAEPVYNPRFFTPEVPYSLYGTEIAKLTKVK